MKIHIKNQTDKIIDICCGLDQEIILLPEQKITVTVEEEDCIYIDQAV